MKVLLDIKDDKALHLLEGRKSEQVESTHVMQKISSMSYSVKTIKVFERQARKL